MGLPGEDFSHEPTWGGPPPLGAGRPRRKPSRVRRIVIIVLVALALAAVARETGVVDFTYYRSDANSRWHTNCRSSWSGVSGEGERASKRAPATYEWSGTDDGLCSAVAEAGREIELPKGDGGHVAVMVYEAGLNGPYWVPLYKTGSSRWRASFSYHFKTSQATVQREGEVAGSSDLTAKGLLSARNYRELIARQIAGCISKAVLEKTTSQ